MDSVGRACWLEEVGTIPMEGGVMILLRRLLPRENMMVLGKF